MKIKQELTEVFLHIKTVKMLIALKEEDTEWYISKLAKESGSTYVYTKQILNILTKEKVVKVIEEGRMKKIIPTKKGLEIANLLEETIKKCKISENNEIILPLE
ncbi:hypothetical protein KO317_00740 [Candidatus Micrarchaeota archaeon]|jgi:predicted transcriptional regulator|nr:hypothetical protein [Candidatus Micrarchaeota archaeon]